MAKILIVEDNPELLAILEELLGEQFEVETARRGEEAITKAKTFRPDLVILDLQLPSMDGIEAGKWIKRERAPEEVPILALTALAQAGDPEAILRSGCCDAYLAKPASLADIRARVDELLRAGSRTA
ncbi:MAG TPA: response regulator [Longimicrobiales bacterium]